MKQPKPTLKSAKAFLKKIKAEHLKTRILSAKYGKCVFLHSAHLPVLSPMQIAG